MTTSQDSSPYFDPRSANRLPSLNHVSFPMSRLSLVFFASLFFLSNTSFAYQYSTTPSFSSFRRPKTVRFSQYDFTSNTLDTDTYGVVYQHLPAQGCSSPLKGLLSFTLDRITAGDSRTHPSYSRSIQAIFAPKSICFSQFFFIVFIPFGSSSAT